MSDQVLLDGLMHKIVPTCIDLPYAPYIKDFSVKFFSFGSCFARNIVSAFNALGFNIFYQVEGCGHWSSRTMLNLLQVWLSKKNYTKDDLYHFDGNNTVLSMYHSRLFSKGDNAVELILKEMKKLDTEAKKNLKEADIIFITLCNATYLKEIETDRIICYNRGFPQEKAKKVFPSSNEIVEELNKIFDILKQLCRKKFRLIMTISPQRYAWEDLGILYDNLDKAKIRVAIDTFIKEHESDGFHLEYFPAYEIVIDELRTCEVFSNKGTHVLVPYTSNYVTNRYLNSHCSPEIKDTLLFAREQLSENLLKEFYQNDIIFIKPSIEKSIAELKKHYLNTRCEHILKNTIQLFNKFGADLYAKELNDFRSTN